MEILTSSADLNQIVSSLRTNNKSIGFVPTMGALHEGHLALVVAAKKTCDVVICSIFVNPTQFNSASDLAAYPKTPVTDIELLEQVNCDFLFLPNSSNEIYPTQVEVLHFDLGFIETVMEGEHRPGHFQGVATVLSYLFELVKPNTVFMGEKDYQQVAVVRKLVKLLNLPIDIACIPTKRNANGLALSSRNVLLSKKDQEKAQVIFKAMNFARRNWRHYPVSDLHTRLLSFFENLIDVEVEYIVFADADSLQSVNEWSDHQSVRVFVVVWFSKVRLIDNLLLF